MTMDWHEDLEDGADPDAVPANPPAPPPPAPAAPVSPEQAQAAIARIRGDQTHAWHRPGHPEHQAAVQAMERLYRAAYPESAEDAPPARLPIEGSGRPTTAAELDAIPVNTPDAPNFFDVERAKALHALAEREGLADLVLEGRGVVRRVASAPLLDDVTAERTLKARWGRAYDTKLAAANMALGTLLPKEDLADLEARDLDYQPDVLDFWARVGDRMLDMTTPQGFARRKARALDQIAAEAEKKKAEAP